MEISEIEKLKKWVIPIGLISLCIAGLVLTLTLLSVYKWGWGTQGVTRALVVGSSVSTIFVVFAIISINFYWEPDSNHL